MISALTRVALCFQIRVVITEHDFIRYFFESLEISLFFLENLLNVRFTDHHDWREILANSFEHDFIASEEPLQSEIIIFF